MDQVVREQLNHLLRGGNAHMTFDQAVADFPTQAINRQPPNIPYTPWHLIEHLRIAQWDILEFIRNPDHISPDWPVGYWPHPDQKAGWTQWENTIQLFQADLKALQDLVTEPNTDLYAPIPHAPTYTIFREIVLVADHNAYHIGELAILRGVMGLWSTN
jgi:hypothetical protein